jgi:hypothetical protein
MPRTMSHMPTLYAVWVVEPENGGKAVRTTDFADALRQRRELAPATLRREDADASPS